MDCMVEATGNVRAPLSSEQAAHGIARWWCLRLGCAEESSRSNGSLGSGRREVNYNRLRYITKRGNKKTGVERNEGKERWWRGMRWMDDEDGWSDDGR
jgi:hypothetical protein